MSEFARVGVTTKYTKFTKGGAAPYINTLERSMLLNMFNADYTPAVTVLGNSDKFSYYTGVFSNATGPDMWESFTDYDSGYSLLASGTWNVNDRLGLDEAFFNMRVV
jgi:hypothetical protein